MAKRTVITAIVSDEQWARLRFSIGSESSSHLLVRSRGLGHRQAESVTELLIVDPACMREAGEAQRVQHAVRRMVEDGTRVVAYVDGRDLRAAIPLLRGGAIELLVLGVNDSRDELRDAILPRSAGAVAMLEELLSCRAARMDEGTVRSLRVMTSDPASMRNVTSLARVAEVAPRSLYRALASAGLTSPLRLMRASRVALAVDLLRQSRASTWQIAMSCGAGSERQLGKDLREVLGMPARSIRGADVLKGLKTSLRAYVLANTARIGHCETIPFARIRRSQRRAA